MGDDFDASKEAAREWATTEGVTFVEDGRDAAITEGAGTVALELARLPETLDAILIPVGNGALINGMGVWCKAHMPGTEIIGVGVDRAPAMERSFREKTVVALNKPVHTVADGVAARVPVPEAVETMLDVVDDMLLVSEEDTLSAMKTLAVELGLLVEGAGAVPYAAANRFRDRFQGRRIAIIVSGSNVSHQEGT